jgi:hypothetical protein
MGGRLPSYRSRSRYEYNGKKTTNRLQPLLPRSKTAFGKVGASTVHVEKTPRKTMWYLLPTKNENYNIDAASLPRIEAA